MSIVAIIHEVRIDKAIEQVLDLVGNQKSLFTGKHVAIKPNETWAVANDLTACTQADSVQAVIQYIKKFDPSRITITGGAGDGQTDEIFHLLGIDEVIKKEGVEFFDHNRGPFKAVPLEFSPQKEIMINPYLLIYDTLISLAQHKVHEYAEVTLTMKNIGMSFPAADYYGHPRKVQEKPHEFFTDLQAFIAAVCKQFPPQLGIITGHPVMIGTGPIGGKTFESELVIASTDFVSCDAVGSYLLGKENVRHIILGQEHGMGVADLRRIEITGLSLERAKEIFKSAQNHASGY
jgi:uncharacterized protein (DUF362 family)